MGDHPGWAVRVGGEWLCYGHGYNLSGPEIACIFDTAKEAGEDLVCASGDWADGLSGAEVVEAWVPAFHRLTRKVSRLEEAAAVRPQDLDELDDAIDTMKSIVIAIRKRVK